MIGMEASPFQTNALIVDPDMSTRMRLKQATTAVSQFKKVVQYNALGEARSFLNESGEPFEVIFISHNFQTKDVTQFITDVKQIKTSEDAAFVLVLRSKDQDKSLIAQQMMVGLDGFLFEPYSVDSLIEMTELARRVKKDRTAARAAMAAKLMTNQLMQQLDLVAQLKSCGYSINKTYEKLRQAGADFKELMQSPENPAMEIAVKAFLDAKAPPPPATRKYKGVSDRVKVRMEKKLIKKSEAKKGES